jgi:hypothetical protein
VGCCSQQQPGGGEVGTVCGSSVGRRFTYGHPGSTSNNSVASSQGEVRSYTHTASPDDLRGEVRTEVCEARLAEPAL